MVCNYQGFGDPRIWGPVMTLIRTHRQNPVVRHGARIQTREWRYVLRTTNIEMFPFQFLFRTPRHNGSSHLELGFGLRAGHWY